MNEREVVADDLFSGGGGWDLAARQLGIRARGVEIMPEARATRNAAGLITIHDDVWTFRPDGRASGLIASPPCQTFSLRGTGTGRLHTDRTLSLLPGIKEVSISELRQRARVLGDDRTALTLTPLWFALNGSYRWVAWEQVPSALPLWKACAAILRTEGWQTWTGELHAECYGTPQSRSRAFLIGSLDKPVFQPFRTNSRYFSNTPRRIEGRLPRWVSVNDALGRPGHPVLEVESHYTGPPKRGSSRQDNGRRSGGDPCFTITSKAHSLIFKNESGAEVKVAMTAQDAAVVQGFDREHPWRGGKKKVFEQIGNAIPIPLALHVLAMASGIGPPSTTRQIH